MVKGRISLVWDWLAAQAILTLLPRTGVFEMVPFRTARLQS
jgi:hypothetical protein